MSAPHGFSWVEKPLLAALGRPAAPEDLAWLRRQGVEVLLSLTEERPPRDWADEAGLLVYHVPLEDMEAPSQEQLDRAVSAILKAHESRMPVAVHCGAGLGRTGVVLAAYLVARGASAQSAVAKVRRLRPGSVETEEQGEAVEAFARRRKGRGADKGEKEEA
jgi:atypical dual specificity phosphatase